MTTGQAKMMHSASGTGISVKLVVAQTSMSPAARPASLAVTAAPCPGHLTLQYDGGLLARWPGQQVLPPAERCIVTTILPSADPHLQQHTAV